MEEFGPKVINLNRFTNFWSNSYIKFMTSVSFVVPIEILGLKNGIILGCRKIMSPAP